MKQNADKKFESAKQNESGLNTLITNTENNIKANNGNNAETLLNEAETLNNKAFEQRKESTTKSGNEKDELLKLAVENEKLAVDKKLQAALVQEKQNKTKFDANAADLTNCKN